MPASVVALSVQTGSGGFALAHQLAEQLGFRYYDWEITSEAAARAGVQPTDVIAAERVPGFIERVMRRLGAASAVSMDGTSVFADPSPAVWTNAIASLDSDSYRPVVERVVLELAEQGEAVIVGHAAQYTLRDNPGVLKVLIHGSEEARSRRLAMEQGTDLKKAVELIKQSDKDRSELLKRVYHFNWLDANMYDLSVNTDHLTVEYAAGVVAQAVKQLGSSGLGR
jgi:cytidylate kinase